MERGTCTAEYIQNLIAERLAKVSLLAGGIEKVVIGTPVLVECQPGGCNWTITVSGAPPIAQDAVKRVVEIVRGCVNLKPNPDEEDRSVDRRHRRSSVERLLYQWQSPVEVR